jgi:serine/threonine-protein kinase
VVAHRARLAREGPLALDEAVRLAREVAGALAYAHAHGVVHRDVKPENILLGGGSHALVADFGIARALAGGDGERDRLTATGIAVGTPHYMSPEQAAGDRTLDGRSDQYSLACVLHEMLTGRPPFTGPSAAAIVGKHFTQAPPPLRETAPHLPAWLEGAVLRALAKEPERRHADLAAFAASLDSRATVAVSPRPEPSVPAAGTPATTALAVLDFQNLSGDPASDWLGGGMGETIQADLQKVSSLSLAARDQVLRALRAHGGPVRGAGDALALCRLVGARTAVWGSYQVAGGRVRITPQLSSAETGETSATEKVDGPIEEIFALQDRVVTGLLGRLGIELATGELARIQRPETHALPAYEAYAKGRQLMRGFGPAAFARADACFRQAVEADPDYALAYSGIGSLHAFRYIAATRQSDLEAAVEHLERARALDPDLAEPHHWLCYAYARLARYDEAERAGLRAAELAPDSTHAHYMLAASRHMRVMTEGRRDLAGLVAEAYSAAIETEPTSQTAYMGLGWLYLVDGQYDPARLLLDCAVAVERGRLSREMQFVGALPLRAALHVREGAHREGVELLREAVARYPDTDHVYAWTFAALAGCELGEAAYRSGAYAEALGEYRAAAELAERHPEKLGIGFMAARGRLGMARAMHRLGMTREERRESEAGRRLLESREGYSFAWMWGGSEGEAAYDLAAHLAGLGRPAEAVAALETAVGRGWRDGPRLAADPDFSRYRADTGLERVAQRLGALPGIPVAAGMGRYPALLGVMPEPAVPAPR